jgi:hypothetical protein
VNDGIDCIKISIDRVTAVQSFAVGILNRPSCKPVHVLKNGRKTLYGGVSAPMSQRIPWPGGGNPAQSGSLEVRVTRR